MAQSASKVDATDTVEYLKENPISRRCRARRHRWPDDDEVEWSYVPDAVKGEPNAFLELECARGCGTVKRMWGFVDLRKQKATLLDKKSMTYDEKYKLQGGARITPTEAEQSIMLEQLTPVRSKAPAPKPAAKRAPERRLRAVG